MQPIFTVNDAVGSLSQVGGGQVVPQVNIEQSKMFDLGEIEVKLDLERKTLRANMAPIGSPNFSTNMLRDIMTIQSELRRLYLIEGTGQPPKFLVLGSKFTGVFNLGGDLNLFAQLIEQQDRARHRRPLLPNAPTANIDVTSS